MIRAINCPDLSEDKFVSLYTDFNNATYRLTFKWNEYCDCCFFSIFNSDGETVNCGNALTTGSTIHTDKRLLPTFKFLHNQLSKEEPTSETIKEYVLVYEDNSEQY